MTITARQIIRAGLFTLLVAAIVLSAWQLALGTCYAEAYVLGGWPANRNICHVDGLAIFGIIVAGYAMVMLLFIVVADLYDGNPSITIGRRAPRVPKARVR